MTTATPSLTNGASPLLALGVFSAAGSSGQASGAQYQSRRASLRSSAARFGEQLAHTVAMRFVIATHETASIHDEQTRHGDIVLLRVTETRFNCALKLLLWLEHCSKSFPSTPFYGIADDDTYLQTYSSS